MMYCGIPVRHELSRLLVKRPEFMMTLWIMRVVDVTLSRACWIQGRCECAFYCRISLERIPMAAFVLESVGFPLLLF